MDAPVVSANLNEGSNEAQAAGMIFGRTNAAATINVEDVVLKGYIRASKNVGLIIGNGNSSAILSVTNMFVSDLEINSGSSAANLIYGNGIAPTNATLVNIHYVTESVTLTASGSLSQGTAVALANVTNEWLETNGYDTNLFEVVAGEVVRK